MRGIALLARGMDYKCLRIRHLPSSWSSVIDTCTSLRFHCSVIELPLILSMCSILILFYSLILV